MRALVFFVQLLFWLLVIRILLRGLARFFVRPPARPLTAPVAAAGQIEDLVRDPTCHTHVPRSRAVSAIVAGREEYFCSTECRDKAQAAVARAS